MDHCAVMRNPFSTAVATARIPDGAVPLSASCRYSSSGSISSFDGSVVLLLYPGYCGGMVYRTATQTGQTTGYQVEVNFNVPARRITQTSILNDTAEEELLCNVSAPNQYRVVSEGLRMALINNSLDNDGWFEAVRFSSSENLEDFVIRGTSSNNAGDVVSIVPDAGRYENKFLEADPISNVRQFPDWSMNPSYISGKLRDIHKHTFMLHRLDSNEFRDIPNLSRFLTGNAGGTAYPIDNCLEGNWFVDKNVDCIAIRCRANVPSNGGSLQLHYHLVQHAEELYDPSSDLHRFMTKPPVSRRLTEATQTAIKRDIKPSVIRAPTAAVGISNTPYTRRRRVRRRFTRRKRTYRRR